MLRRGSALNGTMSCVCSGERAETVAHTHAEQHQATPNTEIEAKPRSNNRMTSRSVAPTEMLNSFRAAFPPPLLSPRFLPLPRLRGRGFACVRPLAWFYVIFICLWQPLCSAYERNLCNMVFSCKFIHLTKNAAVSGLNVHSAVTRHSSA